MQPAQPDPPPRRGALWPSPLHTGLTPGQLELLVNAARANGWTEPEIDIRFGRLLDATAAACEEWDTWHAGGDIPYAALPWPTEAAP